jgi:hypothetical protein
MTWRSNVNHTFVKCNRIEIECNMALHTANTIRCPLTHIPIQRKSYVKLANKYKFWRNINNNVTQQHNFHYNFGLGKHEETKRICFNVFRLNLELKWNKY